MRWIRKKDDGLNSLVGGMLGGYVGSKTLNKGYWYIFLMFVASRIISSFHQILMKEGYLNPNRSHFHVFTLFTFANILHSEGYFMEPDILNPDMYKLYERMSVLTPNEQRWHLSSLKYHQTKYNQSGMQVFNQTMQQKIDNLHTKTQRYR